MVQNTPASVQARFIGAIERGDAQAVYDELALQSQWAVQSIYRAEHEMWRVAHTRFPADAKEREEARYAAAGGAGNARKFFAALGLLEPLRARLAEINGSDFERGADGRWGYVRLQPVLLRRQEHATQALELIRRSAADYGQSVP